MSLAARQLVRVQTDRTSIEIQASAAFTTAWKWSDPLSTRDFDRIALFFLPTNIPTGASGVELVLQWSDDGTTVDFDEGALQQTDYLLYGSTNGVFRPQTYRVWLSVADGLVVGASPHAKTFPFRVGGGVCRVAVRTLDASGGAYSLRVQRLVA